MEKTIFINETIHLDKNNTTINFRRKHFLWEGEDETIVNISSKDVMINDLKISVKDDNIKNPSIIIRNTQNITFNRAHITGFNDMFRITNVENIRFKNCIFDLNNSRSTMFTLNNVQNIFFNECKFKDSYNMFTLGNTNNGIIRKCKLQNIDFLFSFRMGSLSRWILENNRFINVVNMMNKSNFNHNNNLFNINHNSFHSSDKELKNNTNQFDPEKSRQIFEDISNFFESGCEGFTIGQILIFIVVLFVILIIIGMILAFIWEVVTK